MPLILAAWGIAWFVGFGLLWLIDGAKPAVAVPLPIAVVVFVVLMVGALVGTAILGARSGRGIRASADAAFAGAVYGWSWTIAFVAIFVFGSRAGSQRHAAGTREHLLSDGVHLRRRPAVLRRRRHLACEATRSGSGDGTSSSRCVAPFFGYPTNYLVFSVAGGGVFLVGALVAWLWVRR